METRRPLRLGLLLLPCITASGCGIPQKLAVGQMVSIMENATEGARERTDLRLVSQALPANLLLLDGLLRTEPNNREALTQSAFVHFGYALGFVEEDSLELASYYYAQGRDHGLRALERRGAFRESREGTLEEFQRALASLRHDDVPALAWTTANWGRWLSLNLESAAAIAQQPRLEAMMARLLALDPAYEAGLPHVLRGMLDAMRPAPLGGQPDSAKAHFNRAFEISQGQNLLYRVLYAEFYCRQVLDVECFDATLAVVEGTTPDGVAAYRLMNEIARRRARRLRMLRDELF